MINLNKTIYIVIIFSIFLTYSNNSYSKTESSGDEFFSGNFILPGINFGEHFNDVENKLKENIFGVEISFAYAFNFQFVGFYTDYIYCKDDYFSVGLEYGFTPGIGIGFDVGWMYTLSDKYSDKNGLVIRGFYSILIFDHYIRYGTNFKDNNFIESGFLLKIPLPMGK